MSNVYFAGRCQCGNLGLQEDSFDDDRPCCSCQDPSWETIMVHGPSISNFLTLAETKDLVDRKDWLWLKEQFCSLCGEWIEGDACTCFASALDR